MLKNFPNVWKVQKETQTSSNSLCLHIWVGCLMSRYHERYVPNIVHEHKRSYGSDAHASAPVAIHHPFEKAAKTATGTVINRMKKKHEVIAR